MLAKYQKIEIELQRFLSENHPAHHRLPLQLARVVLYVHEHLFEPDLNVNSIKVNCRLRDNNVTMRFRCSLGTGLREYIERLRLEAADRLLRTGSYPVYLVAMSVGYNHQETFCRAFLRHFGCSPSSHGNSRSLSRLHRQNIKKKSHNVSEDL
jgi:AraC-like DNA-binding protein